jgi:hypothetical protein
MLIRGDIELDEPILDWSVLIVARVAGGVG